MRRIIIALALILGATPASAAPPGPAPDVPARFDGAIPSLRGATSAPEASSLLRGMRQLQERRVPEGTILLGDPPPTKLAPGVSVTLQVVDIDGDGVEELVQIRGTITTPRLQLTDGSTGTAIWSKLMPTYQFVVRLLPDGDAQDLLVFMPGSISRYDGATGNVLWQSGYPSGTWIGYFGVSPGSGGGDFVVGGWSVPYPQILELRLEFRSLIDGAVRGSLTIQGEGDFPSAAIAGDLDGDGVGDVFTFSPIYTFSAATTGLLKAVGNRGTTDLWSTPVAVEVTDHIFLIDGGDISGDGRGDAVLLSEWLGIDATRVVEQIVTVVDGGGGMTAGLQPVTQVSLGLVAQSFTAPGDVDGVPGRELIFSGAMYSTSQGQGMVVFEAIGRNGRRWLASPGYGASYSDFRWGWWSDAGDLDGDGVRDALALLGNATVGVDRAVAVSQRNGSTIWQRNGLGGRFVAPVHADADGDRADDVASDVSGDHPTSSTTRFRFTVARGRNLAPLWSHTKVVDSGYPSWSLYLNGGALRRDAGHDLIAEYVQGGPGRHAAEVFEGATGAVRWTSP